MASAPNSKLGQRQHHRRDRQRHLLCIAWDKDASRTVEGSCGPVNWAVSCAQRAVAETVPVCVSYAYLAEPG